MRSIGHFVCVFAWRSSDKMGMCVWEHVPQHVPPPWLLNRIFFRPPVIPLLPQAVSQSQRSLIITPPAVKLSSTCSSLSRGSSLMTSLIFLTLRITKDVLVCAFVRLKQLNTRPYSQGWRKNTDPQKHMEMLWNERDYTVESQAIVSVTPAEVFGNHLEWFPHFQM